MATPTSGMDERPCNPSEPAAPRPLVIAAVALLKGDLFFELVAAYSRLGPCHLLDVLAWHRRGRAYARWQLSERVPTHWETLPLNEAVVEFARGEVGLGRPVILVCSTAFLRIEALKNQSPFFTGTIIVPETSSSRTMGETLAREFPQGFDYLGCSAADLEVWRRASAAILVDAPRQLERSVAALVPTSVRIASTSHLGALLESLRLHQWSKNLLVFAPLVLGGRLNDLASLRATVVAFVALGLVASSTYLLNDILDVADDRRHWSKRQRPVARGDLTTSAAAKAAIVGLGAGLSLGALVSSLALSVLFSYVTLTLLYSLGVKRLPLVDGVALATLFTLRLALGVVAAQVPPSPWLFIFSMFLFTSLCLAKRYTELGRMGGVQAAKVAGRGYRAEDSPLVLAVGIAAGLGAVMVMVFYIIEDAFRQSFYGSTAWLWGFPPVIFLLICRVWLVTVRGEMNDDPVKFILGDRASQSLLGLLVICFAFAWLA